VGRLAVAGELSAAIAHELNQPLTGIVTNAQAALRFLDSDPGNLGEVREILADIAVDGRRAGEVISRLRALLRKGPLDMHPIDVNDLVEQTARMLASDLLLRGTALDLELSPELLSIRGDRVHLQQVVLNLVLNGVEAMTSVPPEARRLCVRTIPAPGRKVILEVRDAGTGIPASAMPHLFDPFFTTKSSGMGMGLSIVRSIVQNHGGRIWASNNPAGGATFTLALPAIVAEGTPA
jgi:C4-dicarboxylate-specific signal transduction histidine kinase